MQSEIVFEMQENTRELNGGKKLKGLNLERFLH